MEQEKYIFSGDEKEVLQIIDDFLNGKMKMEISTKSTP